MRGGEGRRWLFVARVELSYRKNKSATQNNIFFTLLDLPTVWYIQMKVCIGIRPLRSVENDKLFTLIQLWPLLRLSHDIMNRGSNDVICHQLS